MPIQVQFLGATRTVTGSMHRVTTSKGSILLDCGLYQGRRKESRERNQQLPFDPNSIDAMILSHAHIDHCGNIPSMTKVGYDRPIYATDATCDLVEIMLRDSAHIQEQDARWLNRRYKKRKKKEGSISPIYTSHDAEKVFPLMQSRDYHAPFEVMEGVTCRFLDAGHILGSAVTVLDIEDGDDELRLVFSGDLGRWEKPVLRDPEIPEKPTYVIMESTYGNRDHPEFGDTDGVLAHHVWEAASRGGKIIVPSFALERAQELVYALKRLHTEGRIPDIKIFVDSPMAVNVTEVFRRHPECFDAETLDFLKKEGDPFGFDHVTFIRDVEESKKLNNLKGPAIIISASGMCENGRIVHHLKNHIGQPENMVMIVGFQAEHTLGRRIVEKRESVNIWGEPFDLNAEVVVLNAFSGHADRGDLLTWIRGCGDSVKEVFLVHGEESRMEAFSGTLQQEGFGDVHMPVHRQKFNLDSA